jgi:hypothetical protein
MRAAKPRDSGQIASTLPSEASGAAAGRQVQRRASRRPLGRARPARDGRSAHPDSGEATAALRRDGPPHRELVVNFKNASFSITAEVHGSPVTTDYGQRKFSGEVEWVEVDVGVDDHNHLIEPADRVNLAMAFQ